MASRIDDVLALSATEVEARVRHLKESGTLVAVADRAVARSAAPKMANALYKTEGGIELANTMVLAPAATNMAAVILRERAAERLAHAMLASPPAIALAVSLAGAESGARVTAELFGSPQKVFGSDYPHSLIGRAILEAADASEARRVQQNLTSTGTKNLLTLRLAGEADLAAMSWLEKLARDGMPSAGPDAQSERPNSVVYLGYLGGFHAAMTAIVLVAALTTSDRTTRRPVASAPVAPTPPASTTRTTPPTPAAPAASPPASPTRAPADFSPISFSEMQALPSRELWGRLESLSASSAAAALARDLPATVAVQKAQAFVETDGDLEFARRLMQAPAARTIAADLTTGDVSVLMGIEPGRTLARDLAADSAGRQLAVALLGTDNGRRILNSLATTDAASRIMRAPGTDPTRQAIAEGLIASDTARLIIEEIATNSAARSTFLKLVATEATVELADVMVAAPVTRQLIQVAKATDHAPYRDAVVGAGPSYADLAHRFTTADAHARHFTYPMLTRDEAIERIGVAVQDRLLVSTCMVMTALAGAHAALTAVSIAHALN